MVDENFMNKLHQMKAALGLPGNLKNAEKLVEKRKQTGLNNNTNNTLSQKRDERKNGLDRGPVINLSYRTQYNIEKYESKIGEQRGRIVNTPFGGHIIFEKQYPLEFQHGKCSLKNCLCLNRDTLSYLGETGKSDIRSFLFLDTETTGLNGGAGTIPFLIGTGYYDCSGFHLAQYFVGDFHQEEAVLYSLNTLLKQFKGVVTFNGKTFDWPLIKDRFTLHKMQFSLKEPYHIDLLYPARKLWKERINSCSLINLEKRILEFHRFNDIPGYLIPGLYFQYLNSLDWSCINPIINHNTLDILSMVSLTSKIGKAIEDPLGKGANCGTEWFALGKIFEGRGNVRESEKCYQAAAKTAEGGKKKEALLRLAQMYKRNKSWEKAVYVWLQSVEENVQTIEPFIELAKYYEHREKNIELAVKYTEKAMHLLNNRFLMFKMIPDQQLVEKIEHRLLRLRKKKTRRSFDVK